MLPMLFVLEADVVRILIVCGCCSRTSSARWPERRFECRTCADVEVVELPPAPRA